MSDQPEPPDGEKATRRRGAALVAAILDAAWNVLETDGWGGVTFYGGADAAHSGKPALGEPGGPAPGHAAPPGRAQPQRAPRYRQPARGHDRAADPDQRAAQQHGRGDVHVDGRAVPGAQPGAGRAAPGVPGRPRAGHGG